MYELYKEKPELLLARWTRNHDVYKVFMAPVCPKISRDEMRSHHKNNVSQQLSNDWEIDIPSDEIELYVVSLENF